MSVALSRLFARYPRMKLTASRLMAVVPSRLRTPRAFIEWYSFYRETEFWTKEQHEAYQLDRIRELLTELKIGSDYYRDQLADVSPSDIQTLDDYRAAVPVIDRETYRSNFDRILDTRANLAKYKKGSTSGTTGLALQFYHSREDNAREWASICHQWSRVGFDPMKSIRAEFRGLTSRPGAVDKYPHENMVRVDILNMNATTVRHYADEMAANRVAFYHGYPSALSTLADIVVASGIRFPSPRAFLLASEMMYDWQLEKIRNAFPGVPVYAHYGCAERTVLAGWCEHSESYHAIPAYALVERDEDTGEIIGTNLHNTVNAFLRFRMTDTAASASNDPCPGCGRVYTPRLDAIEGRAEDYIYSRQRGWVPPALITYPFKGLVGISNTQIHQREPDTIRIDYLTHPGAAEQAVNADQERLRAGFVKILGENMQICFEPVDHIERTAAGKYKWVVSGLSRDESYD